MIDSWSKECACRGLIPIVSEYTFGTANISIPYKKKEEYEDELTIYR